MQSAIASPCILICQLDLRTDLCAGCGRTRAEIARWRSYSDAERDAIMAELPERLDAAGLTPPTLD